MSGTNKLAAEKNQRTLLELVSQPGNGTCAPSHKLYDRLCHSLGTNFCFSIQIHARIARPELQDGPRITWASSSGASRDGTYSLRFRRN